MDKCDACEAAEAFALMISVDERASKDLEPLRLCIACVDLVLTVLTMKATSRLN